MYASLAESADNSTVTALTCNQQLEVLMTSSSGQLKIWDLRADETEGVLMSNVVL